MVLLDVSIGDPLTRGPLWLYPLFSDAPPAGDYLPGPVAATKGAFAVEEVETGATVPELVVSTTGAIPVLLTEGEALLGAKQNRTLNVTVLLPAAGRTRIPVSCVEAGRWGAPQRSARSPRHSPMEVRAPKTRSVADNVRSGFGKYSDQGEVWASVDALAHSAAAPSPTHALEDVHAARAGDVGRLVGGTRPLPGQRGVLVVIDGVVRGLDLFDRPETLDAYWDALVAGYALDTVASGAAAPQSGRRRPDAAAFVGRLASADVTTAPAAGLGEEVHVRSDDVVATGLRWDGALVHLAAFNLAKV